MTGNIQNGMFIFQENGKIRGYKNPITGEAEFGFSELERASSIINVMDPKYRAKGGAEGGLGGQWFNNYWQHATPKRPYTRADIGKFLWLDGYNERIIVDVDESNGRATLNAAGYDQGAWLRGWDDTQAVRAALEDCKVQIDTVENSGSDMFVALGKILYIPPGVNLFVGLTAAEYAAGRVSALYQPRRTAIASSATSMHCGGLVRRPASYGHLISNSDPVGSADNELSYSDFMTLSHLNIYDNKDWCPNGLDTVHWNIPFDGWDTVDPFCRMEKVRIWNPCRDGVYAKGRGEAVFEGVNIIGAKRYGANFDRMNDWRWVNGNIASSSKTGFRIYSSPAGTIADSKIYFCGSGGGTNEDDSCGLLLDGDQYLNGMVSTSNLEVQETRGSNVILKTGKNHIGGTFGDPGRISGNLGTGTLPSVVAGIHIKGAEACENIFRDTYIRPSVAAYGANNWGNAQNAVHIDGDNGSGGGPNGNKGNIWTNEPTTSATGTTRKGIDYTASYSAAGGGGHNNGRNTKLHVNGVACT